MRPYRAAGLEGYWRRQDLSRGLQHPSVRHCTVISCLGGGRMAEASTNRTKHMLHDIDCWEMLNAGALKRKGQVVCRCWVLSYVGYV